VNGPDKEKESAARTEDVRPRSPDDPAGESQPKRGSPVGRTVESIAAGEAVPSGDARAGSGANGGGRSVDLRPRVGRAASRGAASGRGPSDRSSDRFNPRLAARGRIGTVFAVLCFLATIVGIVVLAALLFDIVSDGWHRLTIGFLNGMPSRLADRAGIKPALVGSAWALGLTAIIAFPLGVGTAIWLEEYAPDNRLTRIIETNIANLAGVPSIVYGILGLALFVRAFSLGRSILAAALTLALLILPVIIIASQEAVKAVPNSIRLGAFALGATRWEAIRHQILPLALPGILTGTILALSRAVGEAAPVILVGALAFIPFVPSSPMDQYTVVPFQIYAWVSKPQPAFLELAAAASIVLIVLLLTMNAAAIYLRNRYSRKI
jgi:phosphate transport system permease protein